MDRAKKILERRTNRFSKHISLDEILLITSDVMTNFIDKTTSKQIYLQK